MVSFKIVWLPEKPEDMSAFLDSVAPYMQATYSEEYAKAHGDMAFDLALWLQIWDAQSGFFVVAKDGDKTLGAAMCVKYRPLWYNALRVDIDRVNADTPQIEDAIVNHITCIADVLGVKEIYRVKYVGANEIKERIYHGGFD